MAKPLVVVLLTEKWLPCVIYLQIGCIANLFRPAQFINNCVVRASGNSALLLKLDILKKTIGLTLLLVSMHFGVIWIALSLVAVYFLSMIINIAPNRKILNYGYLQQFKDVTLNMIPAFVMAACTYPFIFLIQNNYLLLAVQIVVAVSVYLGISIVFKLQSFRIGKNYLKHVLNKFKSSKKGSEQT